MIVNVETMKEIETNSTFSNEETMEKVGFQLANHIMQNHNQNEKIIILCGNGNNGGDGFVVARILEHAGYDVKIMLVDSLPNTKEARKNYDLLNSSLFISLDSSNQTLLESDLIVDAVYGIGYHGQLKTEIKKLFDYINKLNRLVYSIDINSGAEADLGKFDSSALHSTITYALGFYKPFHMLRKDHFLFEKCILISLDFKYPNTTPYQEMNEELFIKNYPVRLEDSYKGKDGKSLLIGGSYGLSGALSLNILGAQTSGCSYIHVVCHESIYPLVASNNITPVFHPFAKDTLFSVIKPLLNEVTSIGYGSGATYLEGKKDILECILQNSNCPVVLDAEAIRLLINNLYILKLIRTPVILTPHLQEFANLLGITIEVLKENKFEYALQFAKEYRVTLVLKGPCTLVISPTGEIYINQTGNNALARAGSGDILTGLITGLLSQTKDIFRAVIMAVWLHSYAADLATKKHSKIAFKFEYFEEAIDSFYLSNLKR